MTTETDIQQNLPLTETTFFILLTLAPEPRHGYAVMKDVERLSGGRVTLGTGTLYGALKRLLEQGWIARLDETGTAVRGRNQKMYALTDLGRHVLAAETARLHMLVNVAAGLAPMGEL